MAVVVGSRAYASRLSPPVAATRRWQYKGARRLQSSPAQHFRSERGRPHQVSPNLPRINVDTTVGLLLHKPPHVLRIHVVPRRDRPLPHLRRLPHRSDRQYCGCNTCVLGRCSSNDPPCAPNPRQTPARSDPHNEHTPHRPTQPAGLPANAQPYAGCRNHGPNATCPPTSPAVPATADEPNRKANAATTSAGHSFYTPARSSLASRERNRPGAGVRRLNFSRGTGAAGGGGLNPCPRRLSRGADLLHHQPDGRSCVRTPSPRQSPG